MKILVYEYFSSGAGDCTSSTALYALGRAMLHACIEDAVSAGHEVYTVAGTRFVADLPEECRIIKTLPSEWLDTFRHVLNLVDATLLIAPETYGILQSLSSLAEHSGKLLLGSSSAAVSLAGDKLGATTALKRAGCNTPATARWPMSDTGFQSKQPWILKPRRGAGCAGIYLMNSAKAPELPEDQYIVQQFVEGTPASVAMIVGKTNHIVLSVNSQNVTFDGTPRYNGGKIPLVHPLSHKAIECAHRIPEAIPGLRGYVGIDVVLSDHTVHVIEVNPRITFTYCGLRRIVSHNLMHSIIEAARGSVLDPISLNGSVEFDGIGRVTSEIHQECAR